MQLIIAVVKPYLAEQVLAAVKRLPVEACAVVEVKGYGRQKSYLDHIPNPNSRKPICPRLKFACGSMSPKLQPQSNRLPTLPGLGGWVTQDLLLADGSGNESDRVLKPRCIFSARRLQSMAVYCNRSQMLSNFSDLLICCGGDCCWERYSSHC